AVSLAAVLANLLLTVLILIPAVPRLQGRPDVGTTFQPLYTTVADILPLGGDGSSVIQFYVGLDGLNVWLVTLTSVLMLPSVLISWKAVQERVNEYYAWLLVLQVAMTGVFLAFDVVPFYAFFALTMVPQSFLILRGRGPL